MPYHFAIAMCFAFAQDWIEICWGGGANETHVKGDGSSGFTLQNDALT